MKARLFAAVALAALVGVSLPSYAPAADVPSVYAALAGKKEDFSVLLLAITEAKEVATLKTRENITLFAPTDAAFRKLNAAAIKKLVGDKNTVSKLVLAHLVDRKLTTGELTKLDGKEFHTLQGSSLKVEKLKDVFRIGDAKTVETDIVCSNGVIHVIDTVLPLKE